MDVVNKIVNSPFCSFTPGGLNLLTWLDSASEPYCWRSDARRSNNGRIIWMSGAGEHKALVGRDGLYHHTHASLTGHRRSRGHIWRESTHNKILIILFISPIWKKIYIYIFPWVKRKILFQNSKWSKRAPVGSAKSLMKKKKRKVTKQNKNNKNFSDNPGTDYKTESLETYQLRHKCVWADAHTHWTFSSRSLRTSADRYALQPKRPLSEASEEFWQPDIICELRLSEHVEPLGGWRDATFEKIEIKYRLAVWRLPGGCTTGAVRGAQLPHSSGLLTLPGFVQWAVSANIRVTSTGTSHLPHFYCHPMHLNINSIVFVSFGTQCFDQSGEFVGCLI